MVAGNLCLHRGARVVDREELDAVKAPLATESWFPLRHGHVLDVVLATLERAGFEVQNTQLSLSHDNARFFGTLDLSTPVIRDTNLAVGVRNSVDKTFPLGFCAGCRVFVCDNLAFRSELLVARKHTRNGDVRFQEAIALAVQSLDQFRATEAQRLELMRSSQLAGSDADSLILQAYESGIISLRTLPEVLRAWRKPPFAEFEERNLWTLLNAFTGVIKSRATSNPQQFALQTIRLNALLSPPEPKPCQDLNATAAEHVAVAL
jgi:hypothetical protein